MNNKKTSLLRATLAVLTLSATTARGEEVQTLPEITVTASPTTDSGYLATQSATGTKTDTPLIETPQSISVITRDRLDALGAINIGEALRYTPGVQGEVGFDSRFDFYSIRGFDGTADSLYRDGLQLRSPGFRQFRYEPYGLERIEVLRGPASVLYGQGSPGGLVNFITKRPTAEPFYEIKLEPGNFERFQGAFDLSGPLKQDGTLLYRLTGLARDSDTQVDFVEDDRLFIAPALTWQPRDNTSLTIVSHYEDDSTGSSNNFHPASGTVLPNPHGGIPVNRFLGEPDFDKYDRTEYSVGYLFEHRANDTWTFRQKARYDHLDVDVEQVFSQGLDPDQRTLTRAAFTAVEESGVFSIDSQAQVEFATGALAHTLLFGVDYQHYDFDVAGSEGDAPSLDIFDPDYGAPVTRPPLFDDTDEVEEQIGLYYHEQLKLYEKAVFVLGGRQDFVSSETNDRLADTRTEQDDSEFSWRAGLLYVSDLGLAPYFSYAEFFLPVSGRSFFGEAFKPETGQQYEVGLKYQPTGWDSFVALSAFDIRRQNVLTTDPGHPNDSIQTGEIRSRGIELEGVASLDWGLDIIAAYTFQDLEVTESNDGDEGNRPSATPEYLASLWADYTIQGGVLAGLGFGAGVRYTGSSFGDSDNTFKTDDFTLFDAAIHYDWRGFRLAVNADNLFDNDHIVYCFADPGCFYGPARSVVGSVRYRW